MKHQREYFKQRRPNDCFGLAVSNCLLEIGDERMASRFYKNYLGHPYVERDGSITGFLAPIVVIDLTHGEYISRRYCPPEEIERINSNLKSLIGINPLINALLKHLWGEIRNSHSILEQGIIKDIKFPRILALDNGFPNVHTLLDIGTHFIYRNGITPADRTNRHRKIMAAYSIIKAR